MYKILSLLLCSIIMHTYASENNKILKNLSDSMKTAFFGSISSAIATAVYQPCHYAQNQLAQGYKKNIVWKELPRHCFRGYTILAANNIPVIALQSATYKVLSRMMECPHFAQEPDCKTVLASIIAGAVSGPITNVAQLVTLHKQNTGASFTTIVKSFPLSYKSFGRGIIPTTLQGMFFAATYTNGLPLIKNKINEQYKNNIITPIISAFFSAALLTATTQPLKIIAAKLHADIEKKQYKGTIDLITKTINQNTFKSIKTFYTGALYRTFGNMLAIPVLYFVQRELNTLKNL